MKLRAAIDAAVAGHEVDGALLEQAFGEIMDGGAEAIQIAALLVALRTKGETVAEITALARALRARAETVPLADPRTVDTCGTGGDGAGTFNISTTACFLVAAAGIPVAKHGNRAATSRAGSFDLFEALGVTADIPVAEAARVLAEVGIGPFFARRAHPAMRHVAEVRQKLGIRTVMNCMGPLLNPAGARRQLVGVYDAALVEPLAEVLNALGSERALVVHGEDGLDEVTTTGATRAALLADGAVRSFTITPEEVGLERARPEDLAGGDAAENAAIARAILDGETGPRRDIVVLNAAAALLAAGAEDDLIDGVARAQATLTSGAAKARLAALVEATRGLA